VAGFFLLSGGDRTRTGVQTYSPKAFYMFICSLIVGTRQGNNKPTLLLAVWSSAIVTAFDGSSLFCFFKSAAERGNRPTGSTRPE